MKVTKKSDFLYLVLYYWLPFVLWALVIFSFSATSTPAVSTVEWKNFIIKKTIHIGEYGVFTLLLYRAFTKTGVSKKKSLIVSILVAIFYAITDEFHQSFTPGRDPRIRDVFFDSFGSLMSMVAVFKIVPMLPEKYKNLAANLNLV